MIEDSQKIKRYARRGLIVLLFTIIVIYTANRTSFLSQGATLSITSVSDGQIVTESELVIEGQAQRAIELTINSREIAVNQEGFFSELVLLSPGINTITIRAEDKFKKYKEVNYTIVYEEQSARSIDTLLEELQTNIHIQTAELLKTENLIDPENPYIDDVPEIPPQDTQESGENPTILIEGS